MRDVVLNYVIEFILQNAHFVVPFTIWLLAVWRVATLRGLSMNNYQERVSESVSDTLKESICSRILDPLVTNNNIHLPPNKTAGDVIEIMVQNSPNDVTLLSQVYESFFRFGAGKPFFRASSKHHPLFSLFLLI